MGTGDVFAVNNNNSNSKTYEAERLYKTYGDAVYQIQVIDIASNKKTSIGSGFQFNKNGFIATNYHVIAEAVQRPLNNRIEYLKDDGARGVLKVITADVVHDVAILEMKTPGSKFLSLDDIKIAKGSKIFSIGNPHDIGFTIIEGTYNGIAKDTLIDKIHFSGSLNPGMSGGPAISGTGTVVGVNVATSGNQISFLVPIKHLRILWKNYLKEKHDYDFIKNANSLIEAQLLKNQDDNVKLLLSKKWDNMDFGPVSIPGRINKALKCWGGANHKEKDKYEYFYSMCSSRDRIFLDQNFDTGVIAYRYNHIIGKQEINIPQFYNFYEKQYSFPGGDYKNAKEDNVTNFICNDSFIEVAENKWKASLCIRRYKKYPKIFDMHLYMATVGARKSGFTTTFMAQGVSKENALTLAEKFISEFKAKPLSKEKKEVKK